MIFQSGKYLCSIQALFFHTQDKVDGLREHYARMGEDNGVSIAVRPTRATTVRRGQPIARIVLLHADSLQAKGLYETEPEAENASA